MKIHSATIEKLQYSRKYIVLIFLGLLAISIIPLFALCKPGMIDAHDSVVHIARITSFYESLREGHFIPRWSGNLNFGYGHPVLMFFYPAPSYAASFWHFLGFNFVDSTKVVLGISFIASILGMFWWGSLEFGFSMGFLMAILYGFAPYRFVDLYVRSALGEHFAFAVFPFVLVFLKRTINDDNIFNYIAASISVALLILSHNAISIMFLPIAFFYVLYLFFYRDKLNPQKFILRISSVFIIGFLLSAYFWIPALLEGKYTLREVLMHDGLRGGFVGFKDFYSVGWSFMGNTMSKSIGILQLIGMIFCLVFYKKLNCKKKIILIGVGIFFLLSIFLMTPVSAFLWKHITFLLNFEFPWRFMTIVVFCVSVISSMGYIQLFPRKSFVVAVIIGIFTIISTWYMWQPKGYLLENDSYYKNYTGTTDSGGASSPIWSVRFMESFPKSPIEVISGNAHIVRKDRISTKHTYEIQVKEPSMLLENTLYFPGWEITANWAPVPVEFQNPQYRGLMTFKLNPGKYLVIAEFHNTKMRTVADYISFAGILMLLSGIFLISRKII